MHRSASTPSTPGAARSGPLTGLLFAAGVGGALIRSDAPYPRPGAQLEQIRAYFGQPSGAARIGVAGQLASASALARFTAAAGRVAARVDPRLGAAARVGGTVASASLATSGLCAAALTTPLAADDDRARGLPRLAFLAGGLAHGVGFGLLLGSLGLAGRRGGKLPPSLATAAIALAPPNLLVPLYLLAEPAGWLIPLGRFPGLVVLGRAGRHLGHR
jgi:hypothetical protein